MVAGLATRSTPTVTPSAPGRPPRRQTRRRQALGPAGTLFWEHILPSEERRGPLQNLDLHVLDPDLTAQPHQLGPLTSGQALPDTLVDVSLVHPPTKTRLTDPQVLGDLGDRL